MGKFKGRKILGVILFCFVLSAVYGSTVKAIRNNSFALAPISKPSFSPSNRVNKTEYHSIETLLANSSPLKGAEFYQLLPSISTLAVDPPNSQIFTSSGAFTPPAGVTSIMVKVWGGGGGGATTVEAAGGGGGGAFSKGILTNLAPGFSIDVTVGDGGNAGLDGKPSMVGDVRANGGSKGTVRVGGAGGVASVIGGNIIASFAGGSGGHAAAKISGMDNEGGGGGGGSATESAVGTNGEMPSLESSHLGGIGGAGTGKGGDGGDGEGSFEATEGLAPGGGGGGKGDNSLTSSNAGAPGQVIVYWDCPIYHITDISSENIICEDKSTTIKVISTPEGLPVGIYVVKYTLSGTNTDPGNATMTVSTAGTGTFNIEFKNGGITTIEIESLSSGGAPQICSSKISGKSITVDVHFAPSITVQPTAPFPTCPDDGIQTMSVTAIDAEHYLWKKDGNVLNDDDVVSGQGTAILTLKNLTSDYEGSYVVEVQGTCATTTSDAVNVLVNTLPESAGLIKGEGTVCQGESGVTYSVPPIANATGYVWSLPEGAIVADGENTSSIVIDFSASAVSGNITVYGQNDCGDGTISTSFEVTVNPLPTITLSLIPTICLGSGSFVLPYISTTENPTSYSISAGTPALPNFIPIVNAELSSDLSISLPLDVPAGTYQFNLTVESDNSCVSASTSFNVTFEEDVISPVISDCPTDITVYTGPGSTTCTQVANWTMPTATDNCTSIDKLTWTSSHNSGSIFSVGTTPVTYTVKDISNNTATCSFNVIVIDNTPPTFTPPGPISINSNGACTYNVNPDLFTGPVTVLSDNCTPSTSLRINYLDVVDNYLSPGCSYPFTIRRVWTVKDLADNSTTHDQIITIRDVTPPQITSMPPTRNVECNTNYSPVYPADYPKATDCSTVAFTYEDKIVNGNCTGKATVTRVWKATDCSGNFSVANQTIEVNDTKAPVVSFPASLRHEEQVSCPENIPDELDFISKIIATDDCGIATVEYLREEYYGLGGKPGFCPDGVTRFYRVRDNCNNWVEVSHYIKVLDECECSLCVNTPFKYVDLEKTPVWISPSMERGGKNSACCPIDPPDENCISFFVWLGKDAVGLKFDIIDGAIPSGSLYYKIDCEGAGTPVGEGKCLSGGAWYTISFCKPGGNKNIYKIEAINGVGSVDDITTRVACNGELEVTGVVENTVTWIDKSGKGYEKYLSPSQGSLTPVFFVPESDKNTVPSFIDYEVCGQIPGTTVCGSLFTDCKTVRVNILPKIEIKIDIDPDKICEGHMPVISPVINPMDDDYVFHWYNSSYVEINSGSQTFLPTAEGDYFVKVVKMDGVINCAESELFPFKVAYDKTGPAAVDDLPLPLQLSCDDPNKLQKISDWMAKHKAIYSGPDGIPVTIVMTPSYPSISNTTCGTIPVLFTATDQCGNDAIIKSSIVITDSTKPVVSKQPQNGSSDCVSVDPMLDAGYVAWLVSHGGATASDACDNQLIWSNNSSTQSWTMDTENHTKTIIVTFKATDHCDNFIETATATYTLHDNLPPLISCPKDVEEIIAADLCSKSNVNIGIPLYSDICSTPKLTYILSGATIGGANGLIPSTQEFNVGKTTVTYTVTDDTGLAKSCSFQVWIKHLSISESVISCPASPIEVDAVPGTCRAYVTLDKPVINDPCKSIVSVVHNSTVGNANDPSGDYPVGTTTVTWTITDNSGNTETCIQTVVVIDSQKPTFDVPDPLSECVLAISSASFYTPTNSIDPNDRPEYYVFVSGNKALDLDPSTFADNCSLQKEGCTPEIRWSITMANGDQIPAAIPYFTGQPSTYGSNISFLGDGVTFEDVMHTITYWIVDCNNQPSEPIPQKIIIKPRPFIEKVFK